MIRLGLCCVFREVPIRFRTTTAAVCQTLSRRAALAKLAALCAENARSLAQAIGYCATHEIGAFRIGSGILPLKTHPAVGYRVDDLPDADALEASFRQCGALARRHGVRLLFHPDQFVLLGSPRADITAASLAEIEWQAAVSEWVGADVINIHGGGGYGDKAAALTRVCRRIERLSDAARARLTFENDDRVFTPSDLLPLCRDTGMPFVYDVHHHRCLPDGRPVADITAAALETWNREPVFHLSSPLNGWRGPHPNRHADYIRIADFPEEWAEADCTVEVEAKAKEKAVARLLAALRKRGVATTGHARSVNHS